MSLYAMLSESAHPNYEGTSVGYSSIDHVNHVVLFSNKWKDMYSASHLEAIELCMTVFHTEYNGEWTDAFEQLEAWIDTNDAYLEATKKGV